MDIDRLLRKRQLNVQEQNALTEHQLRATAASWRKSGLPRALYTLGVERGVDWEKSIVLWLDLDFPGGPDVRGVILTSSDQFIRFDLQTDPTHTELRVVERWMDITECYSLSQHNRGTGVGEGALALKIRQELNGESTTEHESDG